MLGLADCIAQLMDIVGVDKTNIFGFHTGNKIGGPRIGSPKPRRPFDPVRSDTQPRAGQIGAHIRLRPDHGSLFRVEVSRAKCRQRRACPYAVSHRSVRRLLSLLVGQKGDRNVRYTPDLRRYLSSRIMDSLQANNTTAIYSANFEFDFEAALRDFIDNTNHRSHLCSRSASRCASRTTSRSHARRFACDSRKW